MSCTSSLTCRLLTATDETQRELPAWEVPFFSWETRRARAERKGSDRVKAEDKSALDGAETTEAGSACSGRAKPRRTRRWPRRLAIALVAVVAACAIGFFAYVSDYYHASDKALGLKSSLADAGELVETSGSIAVGDPRAEAGISFYPGAKVDPAAYVPLAQKLAVEGYYCVIEKMPFNLAFFGIDAAASARNEAPNVKEWWLAGHSLGGVAAAQYASAHAGDVQGVIFLASYSTADLSGSDMDCLTVYGEADGVINRAALASNAGNLPASAQTVAIEGGNHAGFGDYGAQAGDGAASISADEQQQRTAGLIAELIG